MVSPPSSTMVWPVRKLAPSETIQATQFATSAAVPMRRTGVIARSPSMAASYWRPSPRST